MVAIAVGLLAGIAIGMAYLFANKPIARRTLASSVLLGIFVGVLVELSREPIFTAVFSGLATIFIAEFIRWALGGVKRKK